MAATLRVLYHSNVITALGSAFAEFYIRFVIRTSRVLRDPPDTEGKLFSQHPQIFAMWHGQFMMVPAIRPETDTDIAIIVSRHGDAEILANTIRRFGMRVVRGAGAGGTAQGPRRRCRAQRRAPRPEGRRDLRADGGRPTRPRAESRHRHRAPCQALRAPDRAVRHGDQPLLRAQQLERVHPQPSLLQARHRRRRSDRGA